VSELGLWLQVMPSLSAILDSLRSGNRAYLEELEARFETVEPELHAFLAEQGRFKRLHTEFGELERRFPAIESRPPLFGLPIGVKDIFHVDGFETRAGSRLPAASLAGQQAVCVSQLKQAGGLVLGKTVTTEFAYFAPGPTRNPHHPGHTPGGSSSGSAAAVSAGLAPTALGTQTVGSINRPAAFCGVVGFKPSFGRISTQGVIPLSASYDTVGFFTQEVEGARLMASILLADWRAAAVSQKPVLGVPTGPYLEKASAVGRNHLERVIEQLRSADFQVVEVPAMPDYPEIVDRHNRVLAAEAAEVHREWFSKFEPRYHAKTAELIRRGQAVGPSELAAGRAGGKALRAELSRLMEQDGLDLWISPSAVGPAPEGLGSTGDPAMNLAWTHAGLPTISLPTGTSDAGLPLGTQLTGGWQRDEQLLGFAAIVESVVGDA
jgi:Asp-tRNA(Asn)/Glu-tRNA(Gln) amidotransferase A subunit family amidase